MKIRKKKSSDSFFSPMRMTESLKEMGESYTKKEATLSYLAVLLAAFIIGLFFELKIYYLIIVAITYILFVPQFIYNQKRQAYELRRFHDVNAYMSQMAQSFTSTQSILFSLVETGETFSDGKMYTTIQEAIEMIEAGSKDVSQAKLQAMKHIEKYYGCEKLKNLHDFLYMAEERGGECEAEFAILENVRMAWETAVTDYRNTLISNRNLAVGAYGFLIGICVLMLNAFPENLSIIEFELIQLINAAMVSYFIIFFITLDKHINKSLLIDAKDMSKEEVDAHFSFLQETNSEKKSKKFLFYQVLVMVAVVLFYINNPSPVVLAIGIILIIISFNMKKIMLMYVRSDLKQEIMKAFPKWLFDIMLLMQRQSVDSAIIKSAENAPAVLQPELKRISNVLLRVKPQAELETLDEWENLEQIENIEDLDEPESSDKKIEKDYEIKIADAYMSFLADFNILSIETSMRKLYSLSVGTGGSGDVMKFIIESNMKLLIDAERKSIEAKGEVSSISQHLPTFIMTFAMIAYSVALVVAAFSEILGLLN